MFTRILFPQMMRFALPGIGNNWQVLVKATALVSIIGLADVVKAVAGCRQEHLQLFFFILIAGAIYLVITTVSNLVLIWLEKRYSIGVRHADSRSMIEIFQQFWRDFCTGTDIAHRPRGHVVAAGGVDRHRLLSVPIPLAVARVSKKRWLSGRCGCIPMCFAARRCMCNCCCATRACTASSSCARTNCSTRSSATVCIARCSRFR